MKIEELEEINHWLAKLMVDFVNYQRALSGTVEVYNPLTGLMEKLPVDPKVLAELKSKVEEDFKNLKRLVEALTL